MNRMLLVAVSWVHEVTVVLTIDFECLPIYIVCFCKTV